MRACASTRTGIDVLGIVTNEVRTHELAARKGVGDARARRRELRAGARRGASRARRRPSPPTSRATPRSRRPRRRGSCRQATRTRSPTAVIDVLSDEERRVAMGRAARAHALAQLRVGRHRAAARGDLRRGCGGGMRRRLRGAFLVADSAARRSRSRSICVARARLARRYTTRSPSSRWSWVAAAIGLNLLSVVARSLAWDTAIKQSIAPPHPRFRLVFSAFCVGLFGNAVLPGRVGELARVAVLRTAARRAARVRRRR